MKKMARKDLIKTKKMATIYDGHSHIERRIWEDKLGFMYVSINGEYFAIHEMPHYEIEVWYAG